jgi:hypothetical protein
MISDLKNLHVTRAPGSLFHQRRQDGRRGLLDRPVLKGAGNNPKDVDRARENRAVKMGRLKFQTKWFGVSTDKPELFA